MEGQRITTTCCPPLLLENLHPNSLFGNPQGRVKTYEAIVKGETISSPGVPESFRVLVKELQSLGLSVEVVNEKEEVIQFGKDEGEEQLPKLGFSISVPGPMAGK